MAKKKRNRLKGSQSGYPTGGGPPGITPDMQQAMLGGMGPMGTPMENNY